MRHIEETVGIVNCSGGKDDVDEDEVGGGRGQAAAMIAARLEGHFRRKCGQVGSCKGCMSRSEARRPAARTTARARGRAAAAAAATERTRGSGKRRRIKHRSSAMFRQTSTPSKSELSSGRVILRWFLVRTEKEGRSTVDIDGWDRSDTCDATAVTVMPAAAAATTK